LSQAESAADRPGQAARHAAAQLLSDVLDRRRSLDAALDDPASPVASLSPRDRALARAIVGITLRRYGEISALLGRLIARPPTKAGPFMRTVEIAVAQLLYMEVADHAAVSLAMADLTEDSRAMRYKALANAVLRRITREREGLLAGLDQVIDAPQWLYERWVAAYGAETAARIAAAHRVEPALDLTVKADPQEWARRLGGIVLPTGTVRSIASGPIEALPGFGEGAWWVQDAAAALPARLLGDVRRKRVADLCAAPGGKTAELAQAGASVVAVDVAPQRVERLRQTLRRLGLAADVVEADVLKWQPGELFDDILLDAPCTATGTIRRHPDIPYLKQPRDVAALASLQAKMIDRAAEMLKPGGTLVFATCSLEPAEGEAHVSPTLARVPLSLDPVRRQELPGLAEALTPGGTVRTLPCHLAADSPRLSGVDGFFMMRLRKR
jgi:16S rRNA (cytosine967-C5)-methyltransferase